ncbi:MAG: hypothetical protein EOO43_05730 [Flavobacterium sp.]|nr:MAG: hypothetical protein EOO43_05730 [Flavobacterium sp.]
MHAENTTHITRGLYGKQLAANIQAALAATKAVYSGGRIYLYLKTGIGDKADMKGWLFTLLDGLPEIEHPIERIQFVIYQAGSMDSIITINPTKFDVLAIYDAKDSGLNFSSPPPAAWELEPLPLDHPYYTKEGWLQKQLEIRKEQKKTKDISFDDIKELPNVKPILEEMRKNGIKI